MAQVLHASKAVERATYKETYYAQFLPPIIEAQGLILKESHHHWQSDQLEEWKRCPQPTEHQRD